MVSVLSLLVVSGVRPIVYSCSCVCVFLVPLDSCQDSEDMNLTASFNMVPSSGVPEDDSEELLFSHSSGDVSNVNKHLIITWIMCNMQKTLCLPVFCPTL